MRISVWYDILSFPKNGATSTFFLVQFITVGKEDLGKGYLYPKRKLGVAMHFQKYLSKNTIFIVMHFKAFRIICKFFS